jgi:hypothetical protein
MRFPGEAILNVNADVSFAQRVVVLYSGPAYLAGIEASVAGIGSLAVHSPALAKTFG